MQINGIVSGRAAHIKPVSNQNTYPSTVESTCWEHGIDIYSSQRMSHECSICFCRYATVRMLSFAHVRIVKLINYLENWQRATVCDVSCLLQALLRSTLTCTKPNSISNRGKASKKDSFFLFLFCSVFFSKTMWDRVTSSNVLTWFSWHCSSGNSLRLRFMLYGRCRHILDWRAICYKHPTPLELMSPIFHQVQS